MIYARASITADTGASLFYISFAEAEYFQPCNALAHLNPSANSNKFELVPYHCYFEKKRLSLKALSPRDLETFFRYYGCILRPAAQ